MNFRNFTLAIFALAILLSAGNTHVEAQNTRHVAPEKPKLIVNIVVSQFRYDYLNRYWDKFEDNGFRRLVNRGTYCRNASYNYVCADKGVGIASIVTGTTPSKHGIIGNSWYDDLKGEIIPAIFDDKAFTLGGPFEAGRCSPRKLLGTTFSDEINLSNNFKSKIIGVSLEPISAVISAGHTAKAAYWFDVQTGNFISSSFYMDTIPEWVTSFNKKKFPETYLEKTWTTLLPIESYTESLPDKNPYEEGFNNQSVFPYELADIAKIFNKKEQYAILNSVPFGDNLVKDFAIQAFVNEQLGADEFTDVLFLNFTSIAQIGKLYGPLSVEIEDAVIRLDREIGHLLSFIETTIGIENTLVVFTAEHGLPYRPEYLEANKIPSGYFNSSSAVSLLSSYLNNVYGKGDWIKQYNAQQIYLNRSLIESSNLKLADVQETAANLLLQFSGVQNTITSVALQNNTYIDGPFRRIQNGYNQKRSGDIIINLDNGYGEKQGRTIVSMGYDPRVPLIWYGWKIGRKSIVQPVDLTDIAPTMAILLETSYPNNATGKPIEQLFP